MAAAKTASWHDVLDKAEWVAIVTWDGEKAHTVATWGEYIRRLSEPGSNTLVVPAGRYHRTDANLGRDGRVQLLVASRQVPGSHGPGQGYLLEGQGEIELDGERAERARTEFPWARGALVIHVQRAEAQL